MASDYEYIKELLNASLKPLQDSIYELKNDVKLLNERLMTNREKYASDLHALNIRMEKIEDYINTIEPKSFNCQSTINQQIEKLKSSVSRLETELQTVIWIAKNPKMSVMIAIGLYLFAISEIFPKLIKNIF